MKRKTLWGSTMKQIFATVVLVYSCSGIARALDNPMKGPWEPVHHGNDQESTKGRQGMPAYLVGLFRTHIAPVDGSHCPMYPSCSEYGIECLRQHGFFVGWTMIWDRLYRCGRDEMTLSPGIIREGELKCYDPVENNDFWWRRK